jgi:uncharacterized protein (DUF362 family)
MQRRDFLRLGGCATLGALISPRLASAAPWRVGAAVDPNGYSAAMRAISACGEWPSIGLAGRTVVIKPNLVAGFPSASGATTDPEVVRAVVDLALAAGAADVVIVESSPIGAHFAACGYELFSSYDAQRRVRLLDLSTRPLVLAPVSGALAYPAIYVPDIIVRDDIVFISVGKLKVHNETMVTLSTKNLFGLPGVTSYLSPSSPKGRFAMHDRGLSQAVVDLNLLRPVHFAVIDGIWAMDRIGPLFGEPVRMNTVLAGRNSVAVDRVALWAMGLPPAGARHMVYASRTGLGPASVDDVVVSGDPLPTRTFTLSMLSPVLEHPHVFPAAFNPAAGQRVTAVLWYASRCARTIDVLRLYDDSNAVDHIRTLAPYDYQEPRQESVVWDGRTDDNLVVPPGRYAIHVRAHLPQVQHLRPADAVGWITVL